MIEYDQGDIFSVGVAENRDLMIVFGRMGFNLVSGYWLKFRRAQDLPGDFKNPFKELAGSWLQYRPDKWIVFVAPTEGHGMSDDEVRKHIDDLLATAHCRNIRTVITNGIMDIDHDRDSAANRRSDDRRADLIDQIMRRHEGHFASIKLISLNEVFIRLAKRHG